MIITYCIILLIISNSSSNNDTAATIPLARLNRILVAARIVVEGTWVLPIHIRTAVVDIVGVKEEAVVGHIIHITRPIRCGEIRLGYSVDSFYVLGFNVFFKAFMH